MTGFAVVYDVREGPSRAARDASAMRHDSIRELRVAPALRGLSWSELWAAVDAGRARARGGMIVPEVWGGSQSRYVAIPYTSNAVVKVATATTAKTLLQVATPST